MPEVKLEPGYPADLALFDPDREWTVNPAAFHSQGRNTPFAGWTLAGKPLVTLCGGRLTHADPGFAGARALAEAMLAESAR
jgi:dihydroorotase